MHENLRGHSFSLDGLQVRLVHPFLRRLFRVRLERSASSLEAARVGAGGRGCAARGILRLFLCAAFCCVPASLGWLLGVEITAARQDARVPGSCCAALRALALKRRAADTSVPSLNSTHTRPWHTNYLHFPTPPTRSSRTSTRRRWKSITASITTRTSRT